jgi:ribosomal-protein-alanine N-acetyltransferase
MPNLVGQIQNLAVVPEAQGLGVGTALLAASLRAFRSKRLLRAQLEASVRNSRAIRLYHRFGFYPVRTTYREAQPIDNSYVASGSM